MQISVFQPFCGRGTQNLDLLNVPKASDNWRNPRLFSRNLQLKNTDVDDVLDLTGSSDILLVGGDFQDEVEKQEEGGGGPRHREGGQARPLPAPPCRLTKTSPISQQHFRAKKTKQKNHRNTTQMFIFLFTLPSFMLIQFLKKKFSSFNILLPIKLFLKLLKIVLVSTEVSNQSII